MNLAILDVMLPGLDGFTVGQRIKRHVPDIPILMLSARTSVEDKLEGLSFADDYLTKPFHPDKLGARVEVLLRRFGMPSSQPMSPREGDVLFNVSLETLFFVIVGGFHDCLCWRLVDFRTPRCVSLMFRKKCLYLS